jgi:ATP-dependent helicase HrpA
MSDLKSLRDALDTVMARDAGRLLARWRRVSARPEERDVAALREAIAASAAERAARAARVPDIALDASLPISARADEIVALIRKHQVLVLAGETGSG